MGLSPGALSKSLKILQEQLGTKLFEPSGRGIAITQIGLDVYNNSKRVLAEMDFFQEKLSGLTRSKGSQTIRIATFELFSTYVFSHLVDSFDPMFQFALVEKGPGEIEQSILSRSVDFGITTLPIPDSQLDFLKLCSFKSGIFIAGASPGTTDVSELIFSAPITSISNNPTGQTQLDGWPQGIPRKVGYKLELLESGLALARYKKAPIYCPKFIVNLHNRVVKSEFQLKEITPPRAFKKAPGYVFFVKRKNDPEGHIVKKLTAQIRQLCRD